MASDKDIKEAIDVLQYDKNIYDFSDSKSLDLWAEDGVAFELGIKALEAILKIRQYAEDTRNSELREMLRLD